MKRTLSDNMRRQRNMLHEIVSLSRDYIYYNSYYNPQFKSDKANRKLRRQTYKNLQRINAVILKQTQQLFGTVK